MQLKIESKYVNAVREALTCERCREFPLEAGGPCDACPASFWLGVKGERTDGGGWASVLGDMDWYINHAPPADLQAMLDPCEVCGGRHPGPTVTNEDGWSCWQFGDGAGPLCIDGRSLVELVTDCLHLSVLAPWGEPACIRCLDIGTVSLGFVTATEMAKYPVEHETIMIGPPDADYAVHLTRHLAPRPRYRCYTRRRV